MKRNMQVSKQVERKIIKGTFVLTVIVLTFVAWLVSNVIDE